MNKDIYKDGTDMAAVKRMGIVEAGGELLVVVASALWITGMEFVPYVFAAGAVLFAVGRLYVQGCVGAVSLTARRLLRQRTVAVFVLLGAAGLMCATPGFYFGNNFYLTRSSWLVLFIVFAVIELYTAFRLPNELKND